jgi:minor extracellular serine protease Vpr
LGSTSPQIDAGLPAPFNPLAVTTAVPDVRLGGVPLAVAYAGLAPGEVGVYQINVRAPARAPQGDEVPLSLTLAGFTTSVNVRVVD